MILARMYTNKGGTTWNDSTGWLEFGEHCTTWYGVTCYPDQQGNLQANTFGLIASNELVDANCGALNTVGDIDACNWMEDANNHQVPTTSQTYDYLRVSRVNRFLTGYSMVLNHRMTFV